MKDGLRFVSVREHSIVLSAAPTRATCDAAAGVATPLTAAAVVDVAATASASFSSRTTERATLEAGFATSGGGTGAGCGVGTGVGSSVGAGVGGSSSVSVLAAVFVEASVREAVDGSDTVGSCVRVGGTSTVGVVVDDADWTEDAVGLRVPWDSDAVGAVGEGAAPAAPSWHKHGKRSAPYDTRLLPASHFPSM